MISIKRGVFQVIVANIVNVSIGLINCILLPKYLSYDSYGMIKTYTLYISYAGFFHLGYLDGMYLRYGGKELSSINANELGAEYRNISLMQFAVASLVLGIGLFKKDTIIALFACGLLLNNLTSFFQMLFQATGEFKLYSRTINCNRVIELVLNLAFLLIIATDKYVLYIGNQLIATALVLFVLTIALYKKINIFHKWNINLNLYYKNISLGFFFMMGNFSNIFLTNIDRWFVKVLMTTKDFSIYSFAITLDSLVTVFVNPISITFYNVLCRNSEEEYLKKLKRLLVIWGCVIISGAFVIKLVIKCYMTKYIDSMELIIWLFATQAIYVIIKGIYINLYKTQKNNKKYLKQMLITTFISIMLNGILYMFLKSRVSFAIATFITSLIFLIICETSNPGIMFNFKEWIAFSTVLASFILCGIFLSPIKGFVVYCIVFISTVLVNFRGEVVFLYNTLKKSIIRFFPT